MFNFTPCAENILNQVRRQSWSEIYTPVVFMDSRALKMETLIMLTSPTLRINEDIMAA